MDKRFVYIILSFCLTIFVSNPVLSQENRDYHLAPDDELSVDVFDEPDLSLDNVRVSSTGTISMPLLGQIKVDGLTVTELEKKIHDLYLGDYLKKPNISVSITTYRQFYVDGEVNKPGGYSYREGLTVQRAIALAGGFTERAARNKISIVKESTGQTINAVEMNYRVSPGDVITVSESFF